VTEQEINSWNEYVNGNNSALGELYNAIFEKLVLRAVYYTKNPEIARDIVSELFVSLVELNPNDRKQRWSRTQNVEALLLAIIRNKCLDYLKIKSGRQRILEEQSSILVQNPHEELELIKHLEQCLHELKEDDRKLMNLHLFGFNNHEIGDALQISEKTVRNKLSLSRKRIIKLWHQMSLLIHLLWS
jgi:RNA polymerase sigma-70 factor (ECF subfamily)